MRTLVGSTRVRNEHADKSIKEYKKDAMITAKDLCYDVSILDRIQEATSFIEIEKALCDGRHRLVDLDYLSKKYFLNRKEK